MEAIGHDRRCAGFVVDYLGDHRRRDRGGGKAEEGTKVTAEVPLGRSTRPLMVELRARILVQAFVECNRRQVAHLVRWVFAQGDGGSGGSCFLAGLFQARCRIAAEVQLPAYPACWTRKAEKECLAAGRRNSDAKAFELGVATHFANAIDAGLRLGVPDRSIGQGHLIFRFGWP